MHRKAGLHRAVLIALLAAPMACSAQWRPLPLPDLHGATVNTFAYDDQGALWLGTSKGLQLFDGANLTAFRSNPGDAGSLANDQVHTLLYDTKGTLWVGTAGGACILRKNAARFEPRLFIGADGTAAHHGCLALAASTDGGMWAFCGAAYIYRCAPGDSLFRPVIASHGGPSGRFTQGYEATDGTLWYTDRTQLLHLDPRTGKRDVFHYRPQGREAHPKTLFMQVMPDPRDQHLQWITSWGMGLLAFDDRTRTFTPYLNEATGEPDLVNIVLDAAPWAADEWPVLSDGQLCLFAPRDGSVREALRGRRLEGVRSLWNDGEGRTFAGGMGQVWVHIQASDGAQRLDAPLNTTNIAIAPISTGGFWAVRYYTDRILYRTDQHGLAIDSLPLPVERLPYECFQLTEDRNGTVWIASTNGLIRFDPHTRRFDRIPIPLSANSNVYVHDLRELPNGDLGLALGALGFAVYSGAKASFRTLDPAVPGSAADVRAISVQDPDHVLLTIGDGILQVDLRDLSYRALLPDSLRVRVLSGVSGCAALNDGSIMAWSPVRGPVRLVRSTTDPEHYGVDEVFTMPGYPYFTGGCTDEHGDLWLTSDQALWRYSAGSHGFTRFDEFNGAPFSASGSVSPEINGGVLVLSGEGWWRLREGFEPHNEVPVARIRNVLVHGSPTDLHQDTVTTRKLAHDRNAITVEYGAVALFTGLDLSYAYRMSVDGATGEWVDQGPQRSVAFVDLPPGEYRLEVRVRPAAGTIPDPSPDALPAVATWTITPPWWGTWWARAAMLLVAALGTAAITRWLISLRYRRRIAALEQEGEIERMRSRIARDIHDGIGSGLTRINMMSRRLEGADPEQVARIARTSAELVQELGGIVWTVDPRNDVFSTFMAHVRSTVGKQFDGLHVELTTDYSLAKGDEDRSMDPVIKRHVLLMLNEAVNNALKHSGADRIEVRLHLSRNEVVLRVKDNGHGFDVAGPRLQGNGLANFRKRAESMAGEAAITSDADGTVVSLRARLP